ncbi:MAG: hypothetical protein HDS26_05100 [Bacteroides sp.]|nr:hypothetical protein [Bacteroides sp.]
MSDYTVIIPALDAFASIGEVLIGLFSVISQTNDSEQDIIWDFKNVEEIHPCFLVALAIYHDSFERKITLDNISAKLNERLQSCRFANPLNLSGAITPKEAFKDCTTTNLYPICKFARRYEYIDEIQGALYLLVSPTINSRAIGWKPHSKIAYLMSELICNIQEHSGASHGFITIQCPDSDNAIYICIADNGITIQGSYLRAAKSALSRLIGSDPAEALKYATRGISTKDRPDNESRGYGISTNLAMIVNGLKGSFYVLSGQVFFRSDQWGEQFVNLSDEMNWDGTLICVRIPLKQDRDLNVYDYIE